MAQSTTTIISICHQATAIVLPPMMSRHSANWSGMYVERIAIFSGGKANWSAMASIKPAVAGNELEMVPSAAVRQNPAQSQFSMGKKTNRMLEAV